MIYSTKKELPIFEERLNFSELELTGAYPIRGIYPYILFNEFLDGNLYQMMGFAYAHTKCALRSPSMNFGRNLDIIYPTPLFTRP